MYLCFHPQAKSERNYHIFYEMLAGLPPNEKHPLYLQEAETYYYLNQVVLKMRCPQHTLRAQISGHCNHFYPHINDVSVCWTCVINSLR